MALTLTKILVWICLYCLKCTKFGQLILRRITEIVASRCQILRLKCTKFDFGWGSTRYPAGGAYSTPPDPLAGFKGLLREAGKVMGMEREWGWEMREVMGKSALPYSKFLDLPLCCKPTTHCNKSCDLVKLLEKFQLCR